MTQYLLINYCLAFGAGVAGASAALSDEGWFAFDVPAAVSSACVASLGCSWVDTITFSVFSAG